MTDASAPPGAGELVNPDPRTLTVWSDAEAGLRGIPLHIDHRAFPLELFNRRPTPKPLPDTEVKAILEALPELAWRRWNAQDATYPVTTLPAMAAVQACKIPEVGGLAASDELDAALREAFYAESRCISMPSVILDIAEGCPGVNEERLAGALVRGAGHADVYRQWETARTPYVQGSPHLFTARGESLHNPGVVAHWLDKGDTKRLMVDEYRRKWAAELMNTLCAA
ncbi:dithiol-disulfide isomerase [Streptomyces sp. DSM 41524]|uniref:Dithiol-disulfide isomerase n=1 Tax=Streptomyces asiaticus subsp. ignotus TaxID=3098222 RepID=A0ABU7QBV5_9ACTN|nr:dithiol-disulfide isomerase [Streptomyces sp. DSM 41524]